MGVMQTSEALPVAALDPAGGWTVDDLDALPDDGLRRELVDGVLLVSPAPRVPHRAVVMALYDVLRPVCPPELTVIAGPIGVRQGTTRELQPDLVVIETARLREDILSVPPHLVVEVASRSSRLVDRTLKRAVYAERGPDGGYAEVASAGPGGSADVSRPFPVRVTPGDLGS